VASGIGLGDAGRPRQLSSGATLPDRCRKAGADVLFRGEVAEGNGVADRGDKGATLLPDDLQDSDRGEPGLENAPPERGREEKARVCAPPREAIPGSAEAPGPWMERETGLTRATCDCRRALTVWAGSVRCRARKGVKAALRSGEVRLAIVAGAVRAKARMAAGAEPLPETREGRTGFDVTAICVPSREATRVPGRTEPRPKCDPNASLPTKFHPRPQSTRPRSKMPLTEK